MIGEHCFFVWQTREGETPNDRNDRAIRFASKWFQIQMEGSREVRAN